MIYLQSGTNSITTTLYEKSTQVQPYYTWKLERKGSFEDVIFYQDDTSWAPWYWNQFQVVVATYSGLTQGIIQVNPGEWTYTVYEMTAPYDLDLLNAIGVVETGLCLVEGTYSVNSVYNGTIDNEIVYYKNQ